MKLCLEPEDAGRLALLCGECDDHLHIIEKRLGLKITHRGSALHLRGESNKLNMARRLLQKLYKHTGNGQTLTPHTIHMNIQNHTESNHVEDVSETIIKLRRASVGTCSHNQRRYVQSIRENDISFGIGPAGTGKTYLAVACALHALEQNRVQRIILTRPAVEAGERLGFLPGDLTQKIDPYLLPLQDALGALLGKEQYERLFERGIIELAPLAYMRGRTLTNAFVILDEAQNTTTTQMKMFLTRLGYGSTVVINGDLTQADLPHSGLSDAMERLVDIEGIGFTHFDESDVRRHHLVRQIIQSWDSHRPSHDKKDKIAPLTAKRTT